MLTIILVVFVILGFYLLGRYANQFIKQFGQFEKRTDEHISLLASTMREHEDRIRILNADIFKLNELNNNLSVKLERSTERMLEIFKDATQAIRAIDCRAELQAKRQSELDENQKEIARLLRELNAVVSHTAQDRHQIIIEDIKNRIEKIL